MAPGSLSVGIGGASSVPVSTTTTSGSVDGSGLVAHWKFDEGTGTTVCDSSENGNTGTLINGPLWTAGKVGKALYFDGIDDNVTVMDSSSLDLSSSFTLSAWVNPASSFTDFRSIVVKNYRYYLYASVAGYCGDGSPLGGFNEATNNTVCQPAPLSINTWTHLAVTYDGSMLTLYRSGGVAVATSKFSGTLSPTTGTLQIGANQFGEHFKGLIDELRIYSRALSTTEIQAIYQEESGAISQSVATAVSQPFSFSLSNSGDKSVTAGSSVTNSISATLASGSAQAVTFSASGLPSGATASFSLASCSPACSSTLTINTSASTPAASSTVMVAATGGGATKSTTFTLTVSLPTVPTVATPTISPNGGSFASPVSVTLQTATSGASIYYTTNGSTPTQSSTLFTGTMTLSSSTTIKAKTFKSGYNPSAEASASFTVSQLAGVATGVTRYVDGNLSSNCTSGNYSITNRNCTGSDGNAYRTINQATAASPALTGGDTLRIRSGTYAGSDTTPSGTSTRRITIEGYQSENPTIQYFEGLRWQVFGGSIHFAYLNIRNLRVDCAGFHQGIGSMTYTRVENVEITNCSHDGIYGIDNSELVNLNVHHNGFKCWDTADLTKCHGIYTGTGTVGTGDPGAFRNNIIDGGRYHHNTGYGIQGYSSWGNSTIRNVTAYNNGTGGFILAFEPGNAIYNSVAYNNGGEGFRLAASGAVAYNLTAYNNGLGSTVALGQAIPGGAGSGGGGIAVTDFGNIVVKDSISISNVGANYTQYNGGSAALSNSTFTGNASSLFADAANGNFQLISTSTAGADLSSLYP